MLVKEKMTKNPITITADRHISDAIDIFTEHDFHRLPVVDAHNHIIGLLTEGTVSANVPSKATSLSIHEINYLLNQTKVEDIMVKDVVTISPDDLLEEAADVMIQNKVHSLPVIDKGFLVGIITEKDIFTAFIAMQGLYDKGTRAVVIIKEDKPGILYKISEMLFKENISISHLVVEHVDDVTRIVIRVDTTDSKKVVSILEKEFTVSEAKAYE